MHAFSPVCSLYCRRFLYGTAVAPALRRDDKRLYNNKQGRSDGGHIGIYTPKLVYLNFFMCMVVLSP